MKNFDTIKSLRALVLIAMIGLTGCQVTVYDDPIPPCGGGYNGRSGLAFLAVDYSGVEPAYIWGNNNAIPSFFRYGDFYQSAPGNFDLYYEGEFMDGFDLIQYFWDVNYTIWRNPGTPGGPCGQNGFDGQDSFLTLFMDPFGPDYERINKKDADLVKVIEKTAEKVIIELKKNDVTIRAEFTKLTSSRKAELEESGVKTPLK